MFGVRKWKTIPGYLICFRSSDVFLSQSVHEFCPVAKEAKSASSCNSYRRNHSSAGNKEQVNNCQVFGSWSWGSSKLLPCFLNGKHGSTSQVSCRPHVFPSCSMHSGDISISQSCSFKKGFTVRQSWDLGCMAHLTPTLEIVIEPKSAHLTSSIYGLKQLIWEGTTNEMVEVPRILQRTSVSKLWHVATCCCHTPKSDFNLCIHLGPNLDTDH